MENDPQFLSTYRSENAFFIDAGEGAELFYSNKMFLSFPVSLPDFSR
jgi:hypothetical protein